MHREAMAQRYLATIGPALVPVHDIAAAAGRSTVRGGPMAAAAATIVPQRLPPNVSAAAAARPLTGRPPLATIAEVPEEAESPLGNGTGVSRSSSLLIPLTSAGSSSPTDTVAGGGGGGGTWHTAAMLSIATERPATLSDFVTDDVPPQPGWIGDNASISGGGSGAKEGEGPTPLFLADMTLAEFRELQETGALLGDQPARHKPHYSAFIIACHNSSTKVRACQWHYRVHSHTFIRLCLHFTLTPYILLSPSDAHVSFRSRGCVSIAGALLHD
jgi:hypothetical protein